MGKTTQQIWFGWERPWIVAIVQSGKMSNSICLHSLTDQIVFLMCVVKNFFRSIDIVQFQYQARSKVHIPSDVRLLLSIHVPTSFSGHWHWTFLGQSQVENNIACQTILKQRMKEGLLHDCPVESDVREFCADAVACDGVCAGFPCQAGVLSLI